MELFHGLNFSVSIQISEFAAVADIISLIFVMVATGNHGTLALSSFPLNTSC